MWVLEHHDPQYLGPPHIGPFDSLTEAHDYAQRNPMCDESGNGRVYGYTIYLLAPPVKGR